MTLPSSVGNETQIQHALTGADQNTTKTATRLKTSVELSITSAVFVSLFVGVALRQGRRQPL